MNDLLRLTGSIPNHNRLEQVITELLYFVDAGAIYVSYANVAIVTFILKKDSIQDAENLPEMLDKIIKVYPDFIFKFINAERAEYGFRKCKPYFVEHCTIKELVYLESDAKVFYPNKNVAKRLIKKAKKRFYLDAEAAVVSFRNVSVFLRNNKKAEAAFALHQTLRYIYICASELLTPEFISSNCLLIQYNYITDFAPSLKKILNSETDLQVFDMLNSAYNSVVKNQVIENLDENTIIDAKVKIELTLREINKLFAQYSSLCKEKMRELSRQKCLGKSILNDKIRSNYCIDHALKLISDVITDTFKIRTIYCFGYATVHKINHKNKKVNYISSLPKYHFYLLLVNLEPVDKVLIQSLIRNNFEGRYTVTILNHNVESIKKTDQNHRYFFDKIIANGLFVYNNPSYVLYPVINSGERDVAYSRKYVTHRLLIAQQLFSLADNRFSDDSERIKKGLYRKTMEQISVGLIYLYLGYYPGKVATNCLFSLLKYTKEVELPFDFKIENEKMLYQFMIESPEMSGKELEPNTIMEFNKLLEQKCKNFLEYSAQLVEHKFIKMDKK